MRMQFKGKKALLVNMNKTHATMQLRFIITYIISYIGFGIVMSNFTPFLSQLGYDAMQRGMLISSYAITTIVFQLVFGILSDKYQTIKKITIVSLCMFALASILLYMQTGQNFGLHLVLMALSGGLLNTLCGLYDTWVLANDRKISENLSFIKAFGSIGWAIGSVVASYLILLVNYAGMSACIMVLFVLVLLNAFTLKDISKIENTPKAKVKDSILLLKDKEYMLLILILFLLYSMVVANNCTVIDKMLELGANQFQISLKWSMQSLLEIPTYILGAKLLRRFNHLHLLRFSAIMLILQFTLFSLTNNINVMILLSVFQLFSTPILLIASKTLIFKMCKPELQGSSQLIALSIFTGLSSLLIPTMAGKLSMTIGISQTLFCVVFLGVIALLLIQRFKRMQNNNLS